MPPHYKQPMCTFAPQAEANSPFNNQREEIRAQTEQLYDSTGPNINVITETETAVDTIAVETSPIRSILKTSISNTSSPRTSSSSSSPKTTNVKSLGVQFDSLEIRTFPQVLGDHPCCSKGLPLSLGWNHTSQHTVSLDVYESERIPVQSRRHMRLDEYRRWEILKNACANELNNETSTSNSSESASKSESSTSDTSGSQNHCHSAAAPSLSLLHTVPSCRSDLSAASCSGTSRRSSRINVNSNLTVDGEEIATDSLDAMYSEAELKRADRRMSRERDRRRKRKTVQRFFDTPVYAE